MKTVYMRPGDWEPWKYFSEFNCPYCNEGGCFYSLDNYFEEQKFECDYCGKTFTVRCED